ncbi:MAG: FmdB family transcriptional regulator [Candidatus Margulisbacteria bacterium]|nr:FmdB family transcriptional regulator [Candidatus Margulisiibacteriota bacterium]
MPTYTYKCRSCLHRFDIVQSMIEKELDTCPECSGSIHRVMGKNVGIQFKGSGFYVTDIQKKSKKAASSDTSKESDKETSSDKNSETKSDSGTQSETSSKEKSKTTQKKKTEKKSKSSE